MKGWKAGKEPNANRSHRINWKDPKNSELFWSQKSHVEVANAVGLTPSSVGARRRRAGWKKTGKPRERRSTRPVVHGRSRYNRYGCRCKICRDAHEQNKRDQRARAKERKAQAIPAHIEHGTVACYSNYGCRCSPCKAAWSAHGKQQRHQRRVRDEHRDHAHG